MGKEKKAKKQKRERRRQETVFAYTDGSGGRKRFGWGVLIQAPAEKGYTCTGYCGHKAPRKKMANSSSAGETEAALQAIRYALNHGYRRLVLYYDFVGVAEWAVCFDRPTMPVASSYWQSTMDLCAQGLTVEYRKVKAHSGNPGNVEADKLATMGSQGKSIPISSQGLPIEAEIPDPPRVKKKRKAMIITAATAGLAECRNAMRHLAIALDHMYGCGNTARTGIDRLLEQLEVNSLQVRKHKG